jgi:GTP-binding protein Era
MAHKSGFVNIIGSPNVGKSTLMNQLVGERLSIITSKAQTTRHRILGIVNEEEYQICFSDTPGVLVPSYKLQEGMMQFVNSALQDADLFLLVTDFFEEELNDPEIVERLKKTKTPILVLINKLDLVDQAKMEDKVEAWNKKLPEAAILPISAMLDANIDLVMKWILARLPKGPPYYDKKALTDKPERFFASEIIREKILQQFKKEIPYSVEVVVEEFKESPDIIRVRAIIYVARESQKGIIIGHQGQALKGIGIDARMDLEKFFQTQIFLDLFVKVNKDWKSDERKLKRFGYLH